MKKTEINILFFGGLKRFYGDSLIISVTIGDNLHDVLSTLFDLKPEAKEVLESCQLAVNSNLVDRDFVISEKCELAILPPFSGG